MKIGIIGSGIVGQTLANGFLKHKYEVMIGTRNPSQLREWKEKSSYSGKIGSFESTAQFGEILVLAIKGTVAIEVLSSISINYLNKKIVIDATNPIADKPPVNGVLQFFTTLDNSLMEQLQKRFPQIFFVKAFNSIGNSYMVNPDFGGIKPAMFICGNDSNAKENFA